MVSVCAWVCRAHHDGKPPTYACDRACICICATACHRVCTERNCSRTEVISISMYKRMMPCTHGYCPCTHGVHARMGGNTYLSHHLVTTAGLVSKNSQWPRLCFDGTRCNPSLGSIPRIHPLQGWAHCQVDAEHRLRHERRRSLVHSLGQHALLRWWLGTGSDLSLIHISEPTRPY